jgi:hypothetical protein
VTEAGTTGTSIASSTMSAPISTKNDAPHDYVKEKLHGLPWADLQLAFSLFAFADLVLLLRHKFGRRVINLDP